MVERWIVFGGWALRPDILAPLFGKKTFFIDTNEIMPDLVHGNSLVDDWQDVLAERTLRQIPEQPFGIAGWSTGSLLAYACAEKIRPVCGVFMAATPSFCRRPRFPLGWKVPVLKAMREELAINPHRVLGQVYEQCGGNSSDFGPDIASRPVLERLSSGLVFLEHVTLLPIQRLPFPLLFLHGNNDTIIPSAAGKYFAEASGGTYKEYEGPHAFFLDRQEVVADSILAFSEKAVP